MFDRLGKNCGTLAGHFLSAAALTWASTHNEGLLEKMTHLVDALWECQHEMETGYLSAFPAELFDRFEAIEPVWAPYYTIHKVKIRRIWSAIEKCVHEKCIHKKCV